MDENGLPITGAGVNYSSVEAINQRELITYFNMFLVRTCSFLNSFSTKCESKLAELNSRLASIDASITLLETKLDSVDELKEMKLEDTNNVQSTNLTVQDQALPQSSSQLNEQTIPPPPPQPIPEPPVEEKAPIMTVSEDPRFANFFKMLRLGVAEGAVRLKIQAEGYDPDILNDPNAPAPP